MILHKDGLEQYLSLPFFVVVGKVLEIQLLAITEDFQLCGELAKLWLYSKQQNDKWEVVGLLNQNVYQSTCFEEITKS